MWYCNSAQNRGLLGEVDCTKRGRRSFPDCAGRGVRVGGWVVVVVVVSGSGGGGEGGGGGCSVQPSTLAPFFAIFSFSRRPRPSDPRPFSSKGAPGDTDTLMCRILPIYRFPQAIHNELTLRQWFQSATIYSVDMTCFPQTPLSSLCPDHSKVVDFIGVFADPLGYTLTLLSDFVYRANQIIVDVLSLDKQ